MTAPDEQPTIAPAPEDDPSVELDRLRTRAIDALTAVVRYKRPGRDGAPATRVDFAGFLAHVLATVAANVGDTWQLTAVRPGSWEAALVDQLVVGTVGDDPAVLLAYRTEPVTVTLNVAQLVDDIGRTGEPKVLPLDEALDAIWIAAEDNATPDISDDEAEAAWQAVEAAEADLKARYRTAYTTYAQAFTNAVHATARQVDGLRLPVEVVTETDPEAWAGPLNNPNDIDDPLVWQLWDTAQQQLGLPRP